MEIINFNLRIDEDLNNKLIKIAELEGRSKNKQIEYILKKYVANYGDINEINIKQKHSGNGNNIVNFKENKND